MKHVYVLLIVPATILIPLLTALFKQGYKKQGLAIIFAYLVFAGCTEIAERILGSYDINNLPLLHFYTVAEFLFIAAFFRVVMKDPREIRVINILMAAFVVFSLIDLLF